jgi:transketolase
MTELDKRAVDTARVLAMDCVQKVGNGHPGTAVSLAPAAYLLFHKLMRHDPADAGTHSPRTCWGVTRPTAGTSSASSSRPDGDFDVHALYAAFRVAQAVTDRPSIIAARTIIAWPAPTPRTPRLARLGAGRGRGRRHQARAGLRPDTSF